jgi:hypothetical protein
VSTSFSPQFVEGMAAGNETVHRERLGTAVAGPLVPAPKQKRRRRKRDRPDSATREPRSGSRRPVVLGGVAGVGLVVAGIVAATQSGGGDDDPPAATTTTVSTASTDDVEKPTDLTATESVAGVQLDWKGPADTAYAVLVLSEEDPAEVVPVTTGPSHLIPTTSLRPDVGYCFAVAFLDALNDAPSDDTADVFSPPTCIRGATKDTVKTD